MAKVVSSDGASIADRLDHLPISSVHRFVILALSFAYFFELSDQGTLTATAPALIKIWHLSVNTFAFITSAAFAGAFVGATFGGWFVDRIGRKRGIFYATTCYSLFSLLNAAAWNPLSLGILRFLTGIGLAAMTVAVNTYISEFFPASSRGKYLAWTITFGVLGGPATSWFAFFIIPLASWAWRLVFVWGALGVVALFFISKLEESPRWYATHGQREKAEAIMERIEAAVRAEKGALPPIPATGPQEVRASVPYRKLFQGKYLNRTLILVIYSVFLPLGYYGFQSWVPALLAAHGLPLVKTLAFSSMISLGLPLGAFITTLIAERIDRKWGITVNAIAIAVLGLLYGMLFQPVFIVIFGFLVTVCMQMSVPLYFTYTTELYPTEARASGAGLTYSAGRTASIFGPFIVSFLFSNYGYSSVFVYIALCWVIVAFVIGSFGPLTTRRSLEQLNISVTESGANSPSLEGEVTT